MQKGDGLCLPRFLNGIVCLLLHGVEPRHTFALILDGRQQWSLVLLPAFPLGASCRCFLQDARESGLIDIAKRREVVGGNPLPEAELALRHDGFGIEHLHDGLDLHVGRWLRMESEHDACVGLGLAQLHKHSRPLHHLLFHLGGNGIGESFERYRQNNISKQSHHTQRSHSLSENKY